MRRILCEAEQFVDVALPVCDVHAALRRAEESHRLAEVLKPAIAFLGFDGHTGGVHVPLEGPGPLELGARPELSGREAERCARERDGETGMHQHAAKRVHVGLPRLVAPAVDSPRKADLARVCASINELGRVL